MNTLNLASRILVASALFVSFSQVTHASAEELSEESKMSVVLTQTMEEGTNNSGEEIGLEEEAELLLEDLSEEELKIFISQLSDKELLDIEEEDLLKVSTKSMDEIKDNIINNYYENTNAGMKDYAQKIIDEMTINERNALVDELENKVDLNQDERLLLDTANEATKKVSLTIVIEPALIFLLFTLFLVAVYSFI